ncbi:hypothetical protein ABZS66_29530 [Dactylosporangium sp. NPDC005572]|uniref:hypothetical protein n=1 Tax=Dactylosporangium sp. NPDC005572 TaxID=3156889 RepID=UPI0033A2476B
MIAIVGGTVFATPAAAQATYPLPEAPVVERVEVRVPVDDERAEIVQMQVAAVVGAVVGGMVTAARMRRRRSAARPAGTGLIELP